MDSQILLTLAVLAVVMAALIFVPAGPDLIMLGGLTILLLAGVVTPSEALSGFANESLITIAVLFVVAEGLRQTGAIRFFEQRFLGRPTTLWHAQSRVMLPVAVISAFMNNTPVVAITVPMITDWARKLRLSVSQLLLPLNFAAILGGMCTLVGTSTTLIVNGQLLAENRDRKSVV